MVSIAPTLRERRQGSQCHLDTYSSREVMRQLLVKRAKAADDMRSWAFRGLGSDSVQLGRTDGEEYGEGDRSGKGDEGHGPGAI